MPIRRLLPLIFSFALPMCSAVSSASQPSSVYAALRAARPSGQAIAVRDLTLERDAFRFRFDSGVVQFFEPVEGRITGAVFTGEGSVDLAPATPSEMRHLALVTGEAGLRTLSDRFQSLVLVFTDSTAEEMRGAGSPADIVPAQIGAAFDSFVKKQRRELRTNLQVRVLADLLGKPLARGFFLAFFDGQKTPPAFALADPDGLDWFSNNYLLGGEESAFFVVDESKGGFWYLSHFKSETGSAPHPGDPIADAEHYSIDTTIQRNDDLRGTTIIRLRALRADLSVIRVALMERLRLEDVAFSGASEDGWTPVSFIQEQPEEDADAAIVLPKPLARGDTVQVRMRYAGSDVLHDAGEGTFVVGARESWYPNLGGFSDRATYDLTFRVPAANQVVSVGKVVSDKVDGDTRISTWKADKPIRVAGFNYGKFRKIELADKESGVRIEVFTSPGVPDVVKEINAALQSGGEAAGPGSPVPAGIESPFAELQEPPGLRAVTVDTETLAQSALADGTNTARVGTLYFGPLAQDHVAITQQTQWTFGQSWPSLVFLPYLAFLDGTTRRELGLGATAGFVEQVGPHEFAHQWWGHQVGWASYRDQWLSEGLAEYTASLVLQNTGGLRKFHEYWEAARRRILEKPRGAQIANDAAGPISQGFRLITSRNPFAYDAMIYAKGSYVIHMLRMLMREEGSPRPDARFMAMMKDFTASYSGKNASTRDFQKVVERHMTTELNATADGKMDYFFRQWVYGTEIPRYRAKLDLQKVTGDQYRLTGSVTQEAVSEDFRAVLPVYVESGKGELSRFGLLPMTGNQTIPVDVVLRLPKKPKRALVNALHEVLARD